MIVLLSWFNVPSAMEFIRPNRRFAKRPAKLFGPLFSEGYAPWEKSRK